MRNLSRSIITLHKMCKITILVFLFTPAYSQIDNFVKIYEHEIVLNNGLATRIISTKNQSFTQDISIGGTKFLSEKYKEFSFLANNVTISGKNSWQTISVVGISDNQQGQGAAVKLKGTQLNVNENLEVHIKYFIYPNLPILKKNITIINRGKSYLKIESLDVESLLLNIDITHTEVYHNYCRSKTFGPVTGSYYDAVMAIHDVNTSKGIVIGNESPGVLKRISLFSDGQTLYTGMNHKGEAYPFKITLKPGEVFESPSVFVAPFIDKSVNKVLNVVIPDYVRKHLGSRISAQANIPTFIYNTWKPFRGDLTEKKMIEAATAAKACGAQYFVIDAGWSTNAAYKKTNIADVDWILSLGDWIVDGDKFPHGLKPVTDSIIKLGMKPGLWLSLATVSKTSAVYKQHPEWFVSDKNGKHTFLHDESGNPDQVTACLTTGYYDYIKNVIFKYAKECQLGYLKLDLAAVTSAYRYNHEFTGCAAKNHQLHGDKDESYYAIYTRLFQLFDDIHKEFPDIFIDCTFELMGKLQLIDLAMLKHAECNWLSNYEDSLPNGSLRVRQLAWMRTPVIPASSLVIGNLNCNEPNTFLALYSLSGTLPTLLGDPRSLTKNRKDSINLWAEWMKNNQQKYQIMRFRQDIPCFSFPDRNQWDGFSRINTDNGSGGIFVVFRQGSPDKRRMITIPYLEVDRWYNLYEGLNRILIGKYRGSEIEESGISIELKKDYDAQVFEIEKVINN